MPPRMSAPDDAICSTSGSRCASAMVAALAMTPDASADSAPVCTEGSIDTQTTVRPPSGSARTEADAAPGTARCSSTRCGEGPLLTAAH